VPAPTGPFTPLLYTEKNISYRLIYLIPIFDSVADTEFGRGGYKQNFGVEIKILE